MNHDRRRLMAALGLCLSAAPPAAAPPAAAQTDVENSKDIRASPAPPGFYITEYEDTDAGVFEFRVGDNATDEGRALNRRLELVKKS